MSNIVILTDAPVLNIQLLLDGLLIGAIFALAAWAIKSFPLEFSGSGSRFLSFGR